MRSTKGALFILGILGGYLIWRNRAAIQRQLGTIGINTPLERVAREASQ